ncbi:MAG TPA: signal peptidase I [Ureibacillus sp.]|nr:signal peptidase I [Ureibacillus sp.]
MEKKDKKKNELWEWTKALIIAFLIAVVIRYFLFTPIVVDGESMMPTLENGDRMIVNKFGYMIGEPKRFDIVVFHAPEGKDYIKRVIGLPGDYVEYKNDQLYINGEPIDEPYLDVYKSQLPKGNLTQDFTLQDIPGVEPDIEAIPKDYVLVMGDNRRGSKDSRHIGLVNVDKIIGSTNLIFWPINEIRFVE